MDGFGMFTRLDEYDLDGCFTDPYADPLEALCVLCDDAADEISVERALSCFIREPADL